MKKYFVVYIKVLILIGLFCAFPLSIHSFGQNKAYYKTYVNTNFTTQDGLPSNEVYCVFQDSKGYIWVGTDRGVAKYDGYEFKTYTTEDGLTDNVIFGIAEDSKGQIWFTTPNRTLCYYTVNHQIKPFEYNHKIEESIQSKRTYYDLMFDQIRINANDVIYLSNHQYGYMEIPINNPGNIINNVISSLEWQSKQKQIEFINKPDYQNIFVSSCTELNLGPNQLSINGVYKSDIMVERILSSRNYLLNDSMFSINNRIYTIGVSEVSTKVYSKTLHIYRIGNQYLVNTDEGNHKGYVYLVNDINQLEGGIKILNESIRLTVSIKDKNGGYWLGSLEHGVFYIPALTNTIVKENMNIPLLFPYYSGIVFGERNKNFKTYKEHTLGNSKSKLSVGPLFGKRTHSIKLGHPIYFIETKKWIEDKSDASSLISNLQIMGDTVYVSNGNSFLQLIKNEDPKILMLFYKKIICFEINDSHQFYFGCKDGIYKYDQEYLSNGKESERYNYDAPYIKLDTKPQDLKWFKKNRILAVATTGNGILFYKDDKLLKKITFKDGLVSNSINQLFLDYKERLWAGTNKGINYIEIDDTDSIVIHNFKASSRSLLSPNVQQLYLLEDSFLYVGTDKGLNELKISTLNNEKRYFPITITKTTVNKTLPLVTDLNYDENNIEFYFTALEFNKFGEINYRYRLNGLNKEWIYTKERKVTFSQLNPGKYNFELEAQKENGSWGKAQETYTFTIFKPYWKTWWFIGGICFVVLLIVGGALYYYISNLKQEKSLIEDKQLLSEELNESRQKALSSQLNPHFIFNSLNSIQNFILTKRTELSSDYLSTFSKLMRFVFENSKKLYVSLYDEIEALRLYLELEQVRHNHSFNYKIKIEEGLVLETSLLPSLLVQPIIENAIWHGLLHKQDNDRLLEICFTSDSTYLHIEIKDNGVGRGVSHPRSKFIKKQKSSGVELTQQRLTLLSQSTGLKTKFEIEDLFDENNKPRGTSVRISIPNQLEEGLKLP